MTTEGAYPNGKWIPSSSRTYSHSPASDTLLREEDDSEVVVVTVAAGEEEAGKLTTPTPNSISLFGSSK